MIEPKAANFGGSSRIETFSVRWCDSDVLLVHDAEPRAPASTRDGPAAPGVHVLRSYRQRTVGPAGRAVGCCTTAAPPDAAFSNLSGTTVYRRMRTRSASRNASAAAASIAENARALGSKRAASSGAGGAAKRRKPLQTINPNANKNGSVRAHTVPPQRRHTGAPAAHAASPAPLLTWLPACCIAA